jgi:hypothetical protein
MHRQQNSRHLRVEAPKKPTAVAENVAPGNTSLTVVSFRQPSLPVHTGLLLSRTCRCLKVWQASLRVAENCWVTSHPTTQSRARGGRCVTEAVTCLDHCFARPSALGHHCADGDCARSRDAGSGDGNVFARCAAQVHLVTRPLNLSAMRQQCVVCMPGNEQQQNLRLFYRRAASRLARRLQQSSASPLHFQILRPCARSATAAGPSCAWWGTRCSRSCARLCQWGREAAR